MSSFRKKNLRTYMSQVRPGTYSQSAKRKRDEKYKGKERESGKNQQTGKEKERDKKV